MEVGQNEREGHARRAATKTKSVLICGCVCVDNSQLVFEMLAVLKNATQMPNQSTALRL